MIQEYISLYKRIEKLKEKAIADIKAKGYIDFEIPITLTKYNQIGELEAGDYIRLEKGYLIGYYDYFGYPIESLSPYSLFELYEYTQVH